MTDRPILGCPKRRAEQALVTVLATSYVLGFSARRAEKLVEQLRVASLSKSQVSDMTAHLDAQMKAFGTGRLMPAVPVRVGRRTDIHQGQ